MSKILIIEDSKTDREVIKKYLKETDYEIIEAENGEEGEMMAFSEKPDAIILDIVLPNKNGFAVCRTLKKDYRTSLIPIIMLTSKIQESDKFWGMKQGADEYIFKPFKKEELVEALQKRL